MKRNGSMQHEKGNTTMKHETWKNKEHENDLKYEKQ